MYESLDICHDFLERANAYRRGGLDLRQMWKKKYFQVGGNIWRPQGAEKGVANAETK
jgi:hypothetical protein